MQLKINWSTLAIWAAVSAVAIVSCLLNFPATHIGDEYFPVGHDGFYHARRILDAVANPWDFYEFDPKIHAPEGSLLVWPWGYDYLMAWIVRAGLTLGLSSEPIKILIWIPTVAVAISVGLLVLIGRRLQLSSWAVTLAGLCMALTPTTQLLHGIGNIDHHYAELICILTSLSAGLAWFRRANVTSAVTLGTVFGLAPAIHNGLFVIQIPFILTLFVVWLQDERPARRPTVALAAALMIATVAVLLPSLPFRLGRFEFYTLSWFHLYIAFGTASTVLLLIWLRPTHKGLLTLAAVGLTLLVPLFHEIVIARSFLNGTLGSLDVIEEMRSPVKMAMQDGGLALAKFYSFLIWLAPVTFLLCAVQCWHARRSPRLIFWISSTLGLALLSTQIRMHYFGGFALYLPWLVLAQDYANAHSQQLQRRTFLLATLALLLAYVPQIRYALIAPIPRAADLWFERLHPIFAAMRKACAEDPGIVLADSTAGHYIRYYTECSVISNNFLLTKQQFDKVDEAMRLLTLPAEELPKQAPYVKYVLVRAANIVRSPTGEYTYSFFAPETPLLASALLLTPLADVPPRYEFIDQVTFELQYNDHSEEVPYARLYKVRHDMARPDGSQSANEVTK